MPKGYVIITEAIHDPAGMQEYGKAAGPTLAEYGARVLVADPNGETLEGEWHGDQTVVVEFDTVEQARSWYSSEGYAAARSIRQSAANCNAVIVSGFTPRA